MVASDCDFMTRAGLLAGIDASGGANRGTSASTAAWVGSRVAFRGGLGSLAARMGSTLVHPFFSLPASHKGRFSTFGSSSVTRILGDSSLHP